MKITIDDDDHEYTYILLFGYAVCSTRQSLATGLVVHVGKTYTV